jgi:hypothetical protein
MSDTQLLRLREEYRRAKRHKLETESSIRDLEYRLDLIGKLLDSLQRGESPSTDALDTVNIKSRSSLTLIYKARASKKQTETSLIEQKAEAEKVTTTLMSLAVCPRCSGLGKLSGPTRYERMQEGPIIPVPSISRCDFCNGSGRLTLDN